MPCFHCTRLGLIHHDKVKNQHSEKYEGDEILIRNTKKKQEVQSIFYLEKTILPRLIDMSSYIHTYFRHIDDKRGKLGMDVAPKS